MSKHVEELLDNSRPEYAINQAIGISIERFGRGVAEHYRSYSGLRKISGHHVNPDYAANNLHQQSGFSAEIKHVANNNAEAIISGTGERIARTDNIGHVNHTSADVVAIDAKTGLPILNADGTFASASQMKVYKDYSKYRTLYTTSDYQKYQAVDLLIPSDQYDVVLADWNSELAKLERQKEALLKLGKPEEALQKERQINALEDAKRRVKRSTVSTQEAMEARVSPTLSVAKDILNVSHRAGVESAKMGGMMGGGFSLFRNTLQVAQSEKKLDEALADVLVDTGKAAAGSYVIGATSTALSGAMRNASSQLVQNLGKSSAPATIVQAGAILGKSFLKLARGEITSEQFVSHVSKEGVVLATSMAGSNFGAIIGTMALPGVGTLVGGMIGGMVASMLSGSLYAELQRTVSAMEESDRLRSATEAMCRNLIETHRGYQQELATIFKAFFDEKHQELQVSFDDISTALMEGRAIHSGLEKLATALGVELEFSDDEAFERHLIGGQPLVI